MSGDWNPWSFLPQANSERGWDNAIDVARCPNGVQGRGWNRSNRCDHLIIVLSVVRRYRRGSTDLYAAMEEGSNVVLWRLWKRMLTDGDGWMVMMGCTLLWIEHWFTRFNCEGTIMDRGWSSNRLATWVAAIRQDDRAPTKGLGSLAGRLGTGNDSHHSKHEPRSWLLNAFNLSPYFILFKISSWIGFSAKLHPKFGHLSRCDADMLWNLHKLQHQNLGGKNKMQILIPINFFSIQPCCGWCAKSKCFLSLFSTHDSQMYLATNIDRSLASLGSSAWGDLELEGSLKGLEVQVNVLCSL